MQPTYYTPSIEEFRVGFIHQYLEVKYFDYKEQYEKSAQKREGLQLLEVISKDEAFINSPYKTEQWIASEMYQHQSLEDISADINKGYIRVKHLDQDDIIGEGWDKDKLSVTDKFGARGWHFISGNFYLWKPLGKEIFTIYTKLKQENIILYNGSIFNRSELRFFMYRLGIK